MPEQRSTSPGSENDYADQVRVLIFDGKLSGRAAIEVDSATASAGAETDYAERIGGLIFARETAATIEVDSVTVSAGAETDYAGRVSGLIVHSAKETP